MVSRSGMEFSVRNWKGIFSSNWKNFESKRFVLVRSTESLKISEIAASWKFIIRNCEVPSTDQVAVPKPSRWTTHPPVPARAGAGVRNARQMARSCQLERPGCSTRFEQGLLRPPARASDECIAGRIVRAAGFSHGIIGMSTVTVVTDH